MNSTEPQVVIAVSLVEAARRLGISPRTIATLVANNELQSRRIGRRRVIPVRALEEFLDGVKRKQMTKPNHKTETDQPKPTVTYLLCRICEKRFRNDETWGVVIRVVDHIDLKHPELVLPYAQEMAHVIAQMKI